MPYSGGPVNTCGRGEGSVDVVFRKMMRIGEEGGGELQMKHKSLICISYLGHFMPLSKKIF